jgi:hypothetical protein
MTARPVHQVDLPPDARALSTLPRVDYEDAFLVETGPTEDRTAEQWARAMLEGTSERMRRRLRLGWFALGVQLGSTRSPDRVLGWKVRRSTPDHVLLAANSLYGFRGELLFRRQEEGLLFATFLQERNVFARALWARVAPRHRRVVRYLLGRAAV